jgi:hypothetical protein
MAGVAAHPVGQRAGGGELEQLHHGQPVGPQLGGQPAVYLRDMHGGAADVEEVVVQADRARLHRLGPDPGDRDRQFVRRPGRLRTVRDR